LGDFSIAEYVSVLADEWALPRQHRVVGCKILGPDIHGLATYNQRLLWRVEDFGKLSRTVLVRHAG
jgi:hypothetical protein